MLKEKQNQLKKLDQYFIKDNSNQQKYVLKSSASNNNKNNQQENQKQIKISEKNRLKYLKQLQLKYQNAMTSTLTGDQGVIEIQNDHRIKLKQMKYPFSSIGNLLITFPQNKKGQNAIIWGTGFLIYDNIVLTCAHNVYNKDSKNTAIQIQFVPGLHGKIWGGFSVGLIYIPDQYISCNYEQRKKYDFAMLVLCLPSLANQFGYLGINQGPVKIGEQLIIFGYPRDLNDKNSQKNQEKSQKQIYQYGCSGKVIKCYQHLIDYLIDTSGGQSGSPIFRITSKGYYQVVGIHTSDEYQNNKGVRITQFLLIKINKWIYFNEQIPEQRRCSSAQLLLSKYSKNKRKVKHKLLGETRQAFSIIYDQKYIYLDNQHQILQTVIKFYEDREYEKSIFMGQKYLQINKEKYGKTHIKYIASLFGLANCYYQKGNFQKSIKCYLQCIQLIQKEKMNQNLLKAYLYNGLSIAYTKQQKLQIALQYNFKSIKLIQKIKYDDNKQIIKLFTVQAMLFGKLNKLQDCLYSILKILELVTNKQEQKSYQIAYLLHYAGYIYLIKGKDIQNEIYFKKSLQIYQYLIEKDGLSHLEPIDAKNICQMYRFFKEFQKAEKFLKQALMLFLNIWGSNSINYVFLFEDLGNIYRIKENFKMAQIFLEKSYEIYCQNFIEDNRMSFILSQLGFLYAETEDDKKAYEFLQKSISFNQNQYGKNCYQCILQLSTMRIILSANKKECQKISKKIFRILQNHGYQHSNVQCLFSLLSIWNEQLILKKVQKSVILYKRINQIQNYLKTKNKEIKYNMNHILYISFYYFQLHDFKKGLKYLIKYRNLEKKRQKFSCYLSTIQTANIKFVFNLQSIQKNQLKYNQ